MQIPFSELPGRHERHFRRRLDNPLFATRQQADDEALLEVQREDHQELIAFVSELRGVVQRAVDLRPAEESDVILKIKEDLERLYETSAGLAEDQQGNQAAIQQLLAVIMGTIAGNAAGDSLAEQELQMEAQARALHFDMLRQPLVADLLHPQSLIEADQLAATLLSDEPQSVQTAMNLFDPEQRQQLLDEAQALLDRHDPEHAREQARACFEAMRSA